MFLYMLIFISTNFFFTYPCTVFLPFFPYHALPGCFFFYIYHISSPFFLFSLSLILIHVHTFFFFTISDCSTQYAYVNIFIASISPFNSFFTFYFFLNSYLFLLSPLLFIQQFLSLFILLRSHLPFPFLFLFSHVLFTLFTIAFSRIFTANKIQKYLYYVNICIRTLTFPLFSI